MPVHLSPNGMLAVTFWRNDEIDDVRTAATGREAVKVALMMLAGMDELMAGDRLTVTES